MLLAESNVISKCWRQIYGESYEEKLKTTVNDITNNLHSPEVKVSQSSICKRCQNIDWYSQ